MGQEGEQGGDQPNGIEQGRNLQRQERRRAEGRGRGWGVHGGRGSSSAELAVPNVSIAFVIALLVVETENKICLK